MYTVNVLIMLQTCKNWEKKLVTATMQKRTHIPLICSLCSFKSRMAKVCKYKDHESHLHVNKIHQNINPSQAMGLCEMHNPHPKNLAEQNSIDGVDRAIDSSSQRAQQHVGPLWSVVLEDACHWGRLYMFVCIILTFLLKNMHWSF